ncbi:MAG: phosphatase PAP2 family protein [Myxococcales bacterium]
MNILFAAVLLVELAAPTGGRAGPSSTPVASSHSLWKDEWRRVTWPEIGDFASFEAISLAGPLVFSKPSQPKWRGGILFDDAISDKLRLSSGIGPLSTATDIGMYALQGLPVIDAGITAWWFRGDRDTAIQLAIIDLESYAFTDLAIWSLKTAIARERPQDYHLGCFEPGAPAACGKAKSTSFPSNHAATSFTAASLFCTQHSQMSLYGGAADVWGCVGALTAATGISVARVMADHHYTTDILAGAGIGVLSGWAIPRLLHFRRFSHTEKTSLLSVSLVPVPTTTGMTLSLVGGL